MLAVLLALAAAAGYGGSDYAAGLATRQASVVRVTVLAEATSVVLVACVVPFTGSQAPSWPSVLWGAGAGASGVAGAMALYLGFRHAAFSVASSVSAVATAAFSVLSREQVNDASPQLTVLQRVGGSLGTAIIAVVLQGQIQGAHTAAAAAAAFGNTYWWVMGVTLLALVPTLVLARIERRTKATTAEAAIPAPVEEPLLEAA